MWFKSDSLSGNKSILNLGDYGTSGGFELLTQTGGKIQLYGHDSNSAVTQIETATGLISTGTWYHLALVRSGTTLTLYLDGESVGTASKSHTFGAGSNNSFYIGVYYNGNYGEYFDGVISNVRINKGTAVLYR